MQTCWTGSYTHCNITHITSAYTAEFIKLKMTILPALMLPTVLWVLLELLAFHTFSRNMKLPKKEFPSAKGTHNFNFTTSQWFQIWTSSPDILYICTSSTWYEKLLDDFFFSPTISILVSPVRKKHKLQKGKLHFFLHFLKPSYFKYWLFCYKLNSIK